MKLTSKTFFKNVRKLAIHYNAWPYYMAILYGHIIWPIYKNTMKMYKFTYKIDFWLCTCFECNWSSLSYAYHVTTYFLRFLKDFFSYFLQMDKNKNLTYTFDFWTKFRFLNKILICLTKFRFLNKISIFEQNLDFWTKFRFLNKISIFEQNFDFPSRRAKLTYTLELFESSISEGISKKGVPWNTVSEIHKKSNRWENFLKLCRNYPKSFINVFLSRIS